MNYDRVQLGKADILRFSEAIRSVAHRRSIAQKLGVSERTLRDWLNGKYTMPFQSFSDLIQLCSLNQKDFQPSYISSDQLRSMAGKIGGAAYWKKYRSLGTRSDKSKGGKNSYSRTSDNPNSIFRRNDIARPEESEKLAEFIGICIGDGSLTKYQQTIALNSIDDREYINHVCALGHELFGITPKVNLRKSKYCATITFSSRTMVEFLCDKGLPVGDKIRAGVRVPRWIIASADLSAACARGLMDTDGSIYQETHRKKDKAYSYPRISFVSASEPLLDNFQQILHRLSVDSKRRGTKSLKIERFTEIEKYFTIVGSNNQKHIDRFAMFAEECESG